MGVDKRRGHEVAAHVDLARATLLQGGLDSSDGAAGDSDVDPAAIGHHGHALQFADVLDAIKKGRKPAIDGHEGRRSVEIILGVYKAAESGKPVLLPLTADPTLAARKIKAASILQQFEAEMGIAPPTAPPTAVTPSVGGRVPEKPGS